MLAPDLPSRDRDSALCCSYYKYYYRYGYYCYYCYYSLSALDRLLCPFNLPSCLFFFIVICSLFLKFYTDPFHFLIFIVFFSTLSTPPDHSFLARPSRLPRRLHPTTRLPGQHSSLLPPSPSSVSSSYFSMTEIRPRKGYTRLFR